jgi:hypothetical protein
MNLALMKMRTTNTKQTMTRTAMVVWYGGTSKSHFMTVLLSELYVVMVEVVGIRPGGIGSPNRSDFRVVGEDIGASETDTDAAVGGTHMPRRTEFYFHDMDPP